mgnify:CR=1 FL=1
MAEIVGVGVAVRNQRRLIAFVKTKLTRARRPTGVVKSNLTPCRPLIGVVIEITPCRAPSDQIFSTRHANRCRGKPIEISIGPILRFIDNSGLGIYCRSLVIKRTQRRAGHRGRRSRNVTLIGQTILNFLTGKPRPPWGRATGAVSACSRANRVGIRDVSARVKPHSAHTPLTAALRVRDINPTTIIGIKDSTAIGRPNPVKIGTANFLPRLRNDPRRKALRQLQPIVIRRLKRTKIREVSPWERVSLRLGRRFSIGGC